jgi:hypothetical protein
MTRPDRIQQRILDSWGVVPLIAGGQESDDEAVALVSFLERLAAGGAVLRKRGQRVSGSGSER